MQMEQMRLFHLAASLGSISKAAAASHISQPALSQQIHRLEEELGFQLFLRSNRGVSLTPAGQIVERYAGHFSGLYENLMEDLNHLMAGADVVRIAATPVVGIYGLPCTIFQAKERFPDATFHLQTAASHEVESLILQGESDFGFINGPPKNGELYAQRVFADRLIVAADARYPIPDSLTLEELKAHPLVLFSPKSSLQDQLKGYMAERKHPLEQYRVLFNLDSAESAKSSVLQGHGIAFLPYMSIKKELYMKQLREIAVTDFDMRYDIYIVYKPGESRTTGLDQIASYFAVIVAETFC